MLEQILGAENQLGNKFQSLSYGFRCYLEVGGTELIRRLPPISFNSALLDRLACLGGIRCRQRVGIGTCDFNAAERQCFASKPI